MGRPGRSRDAAVLNETPESPDDEPTHSRLRHPAPVRRASGRGRGPDGHLPRGAAQRPGARVRAGELARDAGARAAGEVRAPAQRLAVRDGQRERRLQQHAQLASGHFERQLPGLRAHDQRGAADLPLPERRRLRPGEAGGRAGGLHAGVGAAGPDPPGDGGLLRRAARAVQRRTGGGAEGRGVRAARAGEAQLRGRRRDDHRHERGAGELRPDRRAGDQRPKRTRQPAGGAARDHRPGAPRPEAARRELRSDAPRAEFARRLARPCAQGEPVGPDRAVLVRHRDAGGRPPARGPPPDPRPGRQPARRRSERVVVGRLRLPFAQCGHRPRAQPADLPGRLRHLEDPRGGRAAGRGSRRARPRAAQRAVQRAGRLHRRQQLGRLGPCGRAGRAVLGGRAAVEQAGPGSRRAHEPRRAERAADGVHATPQSRAGVLQLSDQPAAPAGRGRDAHRAGPRSAQPAAPSALPARVPR